MKFLAVIPFVLAAGVANAHHGSNGQFNHEVKVNVSGVVTGVRFVNPHAYIYFNATSDSGETQEWRCELRGGSILKRTGWTEDMFVKGTEISVVGSQARREEFGCYTDTITFADGRTVARNEVIKPQVAQEVVADVDLAEGTPNINGRWVAPGRRDEPAAAAVATAKAAWPAGVPVVEGRPSFQVSEAGKLAVGNNFNRELNPRFHCQATNLFHDWWFDQNVNKIEQTDDKIVMTYGFMDIVRTIHLDMDSHPKNITPSRSGHSIGKWEGDTLVVDTIGFEEGWLEATRVGVKHSDQMHTVEKFNLSDDGQWLIMTYTINDPLYLEQPFTAQLTHGKTNAPYTQYDCEDLTEERVDGF
jgi:hypothetical protein